MIGGAVCVDATDNLRKDVVMAIYDSVDGIKVHVHKANVVVIAIYYLLGHGFQIHDVYVDGLIGART